MYVQLKYKEVKIKKPRKCWGCCGLHEIGDKMNYSVDITDGDFFTSYWCETCKLFLETYKHGEDLELSYGELQHELSYMTFLKEFKAPKRELILEKINNTELYKY